MLLKLLYVSIIDCTETNMAIMSLSDKTFCKIYFYENENLPSCMSMHHVCAVSLEVQKRTLGPLELVTHHL